MEHVTPEVLERMNENVYMVHTPRKMIYIHSAKCTQMLAQAKNTTTTKNFTTMQPIEISRKLMLKT